mgnify:FL=1
MDSKKIVLGSLLFIILILGFLFIFEKISLKKIDSKSSLGDQMIDISKRSEIQEKSKGSNSLDTILEKKDK